MKLVLYFNLICLNKVCSPQCRPLAQSLPNTSDWLIDIGLVWFSLKVVSLSRRRLSSLLCSHCWCWAVRKKKIVEQFPTVKGKISEKSRNNRSEDDKNPPDVTRAMPRKSYYTTRQTQFGESFQTYTIGIKEKGVQLQSGYERELEQPRCKTGSISLYMIWIS